MAPDCSLQKNRTSPTNLAIAWPYPASPRSALTLASFVCHLGDNCCPKIHAIAFSSTFKPLRVVFVRVVKRAAPLLFLPLLSLNACASSRTVLHFFGPIGGRGCVWAPLMHATNCLMGSTTVSRLTGEANAAACLSLSAYFSFFCCPF